MIADRLSQPDAAEGAILDGFPRTRPQAEALDKMLDKLGGARRGGAVHRRRPRPSCSRRLSGRWICTALAGSRLSRAARPPKVAGVCDIDGVAALPARRRQARDRSTARLEKQLPPMYEVVDYYTDRGVLFTVDGEHEIAEVTEALLHAIAQPAR